MIIHVSVHLNTVDPAYKSPRLQESSRLQEPLLLGQNHFFLSVSSHAARLQEPFFVGRMWLL